MRKDMDKLAVGLLRPINPYSTLLLGLFTFFWGLWLLIPYWTVFGTADLFSKMNDIAPEEAWGLWAMFAGIVIVYALLKRTYLSLMRSLKFTTWHWLTVGAFMFWGDWHNTGGLTYTFVGLFSLYAYLNVRVNVGKFHEEIPTFQ